jgi:hypothetical protein
VETPAGRYLLPPHQAIWIPAGLAHATTLDGVHSAAVFFDPAAVAGPGDCARVLAAAPVVREMIIYGLRWSITRTDVDDVADTFFDALADVVVGLLRDGTPSCLPTTSDPIVADVKAYANRNIESVTGASVCRSVGLSERTLRRRFPEAAGITWRA